MGLPSDSSSAVASTPSRSLIADAIKAWNSAKVDSLVLMARAVAPAALTATPVERAATRWISGEVKFVSVRCEVQAMK